jgi:hypothetical protein
LPLPISNKISLIRVCNNNSNNRNKLTMHLLNSSSITSCRITTSNYNSNSRLCSPMASAAETSRIVRVRGVRAPNMRTPTRRGTSSGGQPAAPPLTTDDKEYLAAEEGATTRASGGVAQEATATIGGPPAGWGGSPVSTTTHLTPPASQCPASTHRGLTSKHRSSHTLISKR